MNDKGIVIENYKNLFLEYYKKLKTDHEKYPNDLQIQKEFAKANQVLDLFAFGK